MKNKVIHDLDIETYHNGGDYVDYWSSSNIKKMLKSPMHAKFEKYNAEHEDSPAKDFGTLVHDFLDSKIRCAEFERNIFEPPVNEKTGSFYGVTSKKYQEALLEAGGKNNVMSVTDEKSLKQIWYNMTHCESQSKIISHFVKYGKPEVSIFFEKTDKIKFKIRPDVLVDAKTPKIVDWKTTVDISLEGIQKAIQNFRYDISAAMYQYMEHKRTGIWKPFIWVFIESQAPFDFLIVDASPYAYDVKKENGMSIVLPQIGAQLFTQLLNQLETCLETEMFNGVVSRIEANYGGKNRKGKKTAKIQPTGWYNNQSIEFFN